MATQANSLDFLAHHEAGHAAVAYKLGFRLKSIRVYPASNDGVTELAGGQHPTSLQGALILLAGGRSESILDPDALSQSHSALDEGKLRGIISGRLSANTK